jgi:hypothetical protein
MGLTLRWLWLWLFVELAASNVAPSFKSSKHIHKVSNAVGELVEQDRRLKEGRSADTGSLNSRLKEF